MGSSASCVREVISTAGSKLPARRSAQPSAAPASPTIRRLRPADICTAATGSGSASVVAAAISAASLGLAAADSADQPAFSRRLKKWMRSPAPCASASSPKSAVSCVQATCTVWPLASEASSAGSSAPHSAWWQCSAAPALPERRAASSAKLRLQSQR